MLTFPIPVVAHGPRTGPGSQPAEDETPNTLEVPGELHTFRPPLTELDAPPQVLAAALAFLRRLLAGLRATPWGAAEPLRLSLHDLDPAVRGEIHALLGEGEVSVLTGGALRAQETAFTGIWRICGDDLDEVEAGAFPRAVTDLALARRPPPGAEVAPPPGLMNAPALYHELRERSARWTPGEPAQVMNLSLLPVTPEDLQWLDAMLGRAGISILSRGYGNCRITATALPGLWWVQYFNGMERLILNSLEVVELPAVALAAAEDYAASIERLDEWIASLEQA